MHQVRPVGFSFHLAAALPCVMAACESAPPPPGERYTVRDSAGVEIVESLYGPWARSGGLAIADEPEVVIGRRDGDPRYTFGFVWDALRLEDGRIAVADGMAATIRVYDAEGRHLEDWGGRGEGPEEFERLNGLLRSGGDLLAPEGFHRVTVLSPTGEFLERLRIPVELQGLPTPGIVPTSSEYGVAGAFADGRLVYLPRGTISEAGAWTGERREVLGYDPTEGTVDTLGVFDGGAYEAVRGERGWSVRDPHLGRVFSWAVGPGRIYVGNGASFEVLALSDTGRLRRIVRLRKPRIPADGALRERFRDHVSQWWTRPREGVPPGRLQRMFDETPFPDSLPAFDGLLLARDGHLWVREPVAREWDLPTHVYQVFDPDGRHLAEVRAPAGLRITEVTEAHVVGVRRDEFDVSYVEVYPLVRTGAEP